MNIATALIANIAAGYGIGLVEGTIFDKLDAKLGPTNKGNLALVFIIAGASTIAGRAITRAILNRANI